MLIASRIFLGAVLAAGLAVPSGAQAAMQGSGGSLDAALECHWWSFGGGGAVQRPAGKRTQEQWILLHHAHRQL